MTDIDFIPGAIPDTVDIRDFNFGEEIGFASTPFDWTTGFDVEAHIGTIIPNFKLEVKDQGISSSCGGQAWGTYGEVWDAIIDKEKSEKSAKFIYAQTFAPGGGSAGRTNCDLAIKQGWAPESLCSSYSEGRPLSEDNYTRPQDITPTARTEAFKDRAFAYANVSANIDMVAQAIRDNNGCVLGITGTNNGTWRSTNPKAPTSFQGGWNHWVYAGKCRIHKGGKQIGFLNSWGTNIGDDGWQWIDEEYFTTRIMNYPVIFSVWTMVVKTETPPVEFKHHFIFVLKYGMNGLAIKALQLALQVDGCFPKNVNTTTYFGQITLNAVKAFQKKYGLKIDGVVGSKTNAKLNELFDK